ncbi:ATP-binding protein [Thalassospiraceae bacterium LMO-JJ14]|nr:ATP-binding protein [Thalassospiraceae bacterium LMO-JJ14]
MNRSLSTKFITTITPIFIAVFVTCIIVETFHTYEKSRAEIAQRLDTLAASQSIILAETIANKNINQLSLMLASIISEPNLVGIAIHDTDGNVMDSFGELDSDDAALVKTITVNFTDGAEVRRVGTMKLVMTDRYALQKIKTQLFFHILLGLALLAAALFASIFAYRRTVGRPLDKLMSSINETKGGTLGRVDWESNDEIGRLINSYNDMQSRLDSYANELKAIHDQLEQRVKERTHALVLARENAEDASRVKSKFLSSMSHEFRTPMNAILGFTQILQMSAEVRNSPNLQDRLGKIEDSARNLMTLLDDIMVFAQLETATGDMNIEEISPHLAIMDAVALIQPLAESRRVTLDTGGVNSEAGTVKADRNQLGKALFNLLSNAVKYNRAGGSVTVDVTPDGNDLRISISDTGYGIPSDRLQNIFEPFNRVGREAGTIEGSGIGLTITQYIVERMSGRIEFESVEDQGSTFHVTFPLAA